MSKARAKTPLHLWIVGIVALLWNAMGAFDYVMTETGNEQYLAEFTPEQLEFFQSFPAWMVACWATAVWGGVLGSLLLLMRKKLAVPVFTLSFVAMVITAVQNFVLTDGLEVLGTMGLVFTVVIFVFALFLVMYSRAMSQRGVFG